MQTEKSRVVLAPCADYDEERVYRAMKEGLALLGGPEAFIEPGEKVLLKPNFLGKASAAAAKTTHPAVFSATARLLQEAGFQNLVYGDSPGSSEPERVAEVCGVGEAARRLGIPLGDFKTGVAVDCPAGRIEKKFQLCSEAVEADAIVNLCKMKTHQLMKITGAVKNLFGCVQGLNKGASHASFPQVRDFAGMVVDLNFLLKPRLHIMDGIVAMEGNGPASGRPVPMGVLLLSTDPVALDAVFCRLVRLEPSLVPTIAVGAERGLGRCQPEEIEVVVTDGRPFEAFCNSDFDVIRKDVATERKLHWQALGLAKGLVTRRPCIRKDKCIGCGACVDACPVKPKAVQFTGVKDLKTAKGKDGSFEGRQTVQCPERNVRNREPGGKKNQIKPPVYNYRRCIRCYCCQEMCPVGAIEAKMPLPARVVLK